MRYLTKSRFKLALECPTKLFYTGKPKTYRDTKQEDSFLQMLAEGGDEAVVATRSGGGVRGRRCLLQPLDQAANLGAVNPSSTANPDFSRFRPPDLNKIKHLQLMP